MKTLEVKVNGIEFIEINNPLFAVFGGEDKFPFLKSVNADALEELPYEQGHFPYRKYKAVVINDRFYAPKYGTNETL